METLKLLSDEVPVEQAPETLEEFFTSLFLWVIPTVLQSQVCVCSIGKTARREDPVEIEFVLLVSDQYDITSLREKIHLQSSSLVALAKQFKLNLSSKVNPWSTPQVGNNNTEVLPSIFSPNEVQHLVETNQISNSTLISLLDLRFEDGKRECHQKLTKMVYQHFQDSERLSFLEPFSGDITKEIDVHLYQWFHLNVLVLYYHRFSLGSDTLRVYNTKQRLFRLTTFGFINQETYEFLLKVWDWILNVKNNWAILSKKQLALERIREQSKKLFSELQDHFVWTEKK
eukprot:TRINITY_DN10467_c0_g1_i1.p1 TRINITY_DN10467_c0_g1~~TRINITY_DN10467_c0_g1_i1.p1  ORF type:complete len:302 (-),score=42.01 TRINITY_DN10467_c0_g1_i1:73-930(-)